MKKTKSAGGIVLNQQKNVLIVKQRNDVWSLPKGHIEDGESVREAAEREIKEESGITSLNLIQDLGSYERFKIGKDGQDDNQELKQIYLFLFSTNQIDLNPIDPDNPDAKWVAPEEVPQYLTHIKDKTFYQSKLETVLSYE